MDCKNCKIVKEHNILRDVLNRLGRGKVADYEELFNSLINDLEKYIKDRKGNQLQKYALGSIIDRHRMKEP